MNTTPGRLRYEHDDLHPQEELASAGRKARGYLTRSAHGVYTPNPERDPIAILEKQHAKRLPDLVPLRLERMLADPFSFYRGTAALQAADLADEPVTGASISISGDAHLTNFGLFASPQRTMVFDLNDFDESAYGPWEWDLKRFVTSVVIAARNRGMGNNKTETAALEAAASYRIGIRQMMDLPSLERYYLRADVVTDSKRFHTSSQHVIDQALKAAKKRTSERVIAKITERAKDGSLHIVEDPPTLTHVDLGDEHLVTDVLENYRRTVLPDISVLLSQFAVTDVVRRVVGIGSVGTRCYLIVLTGPNGEPLVLQLKEAEKSVVNEFGRQEHPLPPELGGARVQHGHRVVANQRILQAVSDPFLGYLKHDDNAYYVRQFRDRNVTIDTTRLDSRAFMDYVDACGTSLARAHAQSPNAPFIAGYLGSATTYDSAVVQWAFAYADQSRADYKAVKDAVSSGRLA